MRTLPDPNISDLQFFGQLFCCIVLLLHQSFGNLIHRCVSSLATDQSGVGRGSAAKAENDVWIC